MPSEGREAPGHRTETAGELRAKAQRVRLHAASLPDDRAVHTLRSYADELDAQAAAIEADGSHF